MSCSGVSKLPSFQAPDHDQVEVVVLGPRYGEAVCVHLGDNRWLTIDSCLYGKSAEPAALFYLKQIGVSPSSIELACVTHWHDDHVRGVSQLVEEAVNAKIVIPEALGRQEFMVLAARFGGESLTGGAKELLRLYRDFGKDRGFVLAGESKLICKDSTSAGAVEVWAMSPSSAEVQQCLVDIGNMMPKVGDPQGAAPRKRPNHLAMVLFVKVGNAQMLFGADLEQVGSQSLGWNAVISAEAAKSTQSTLFKVPHHGSSTAYNPLVWSKMLSPEATSIVTPFHSGRSKLPTESEIKVLKGHTPHLFLTTNQALVRPKISKPSFVEQEIKARTVEKTGLFQEPVEPGLVRCRYTDASTWDVGLFASAIAL